MFDLSKTPFNYATLYTGNGCVLEGGTYTLGYRVYGYKTESSILSFTLQNGHLYNYIKAYVFI